jgi:hypothetical protein
MMASEVIQSDYLSKPERYFQIRSMSRAITRIDDHLADSRDLLKILKIRGDCGSAKRGAQKQDD